MNPNPHGGSRHFKCANCHMEITFPPEHDMVDKMEGTYWIQDQWFCCKLCAQMSYGDRELFSLK
jgi:hypothetical protein